MPESSHWLRSATWPRMPAANHNDRRRPAMNALPTPPARRALPRRRCACGSVAADAGADMAHRGAGAVRGARARCRAPQRRTRNCNAAGARSRPTCWAFPSGRWRNSTRCCRRRGPRTRTRAASSTRCTAGAGPVRTQGQRAAASGQARERRLGGARRRAGRHRAADPQRRPVMGRRHVAGQCAGQRSAQSRRGRRRRLCPVLGRDVRRHFRAAARPLRRSVEQPAGRVLARRRRQGSLPPQRRALPALGPRPVPQAGRTRRSTKASRRSARPSSPAVPGHGQGQDGRVGHARGAEQAEAGTVDDAGGAGHRAQPPSPTSPNAMRSSTWPTSICAARTTRPPTNFPSARSKLAQQQDDNGAHRRQQGQHGIRAVRPRTGSTPASGWPRRRWPNTSAAGACAEIAGLLGDYGQYLANAGDYKAALALRDRAAARQRQDRARRPAKRPCSKCRASSNPRSASAKSSSSTAKRTCSRSSSRTGSGSSASGGCWPRSSPHRSPSSPCSTASCGRPTGCSRTRTAN